MGNVVGDLNQFPDPLGDTRLFCLLSEANEFSGGHRLSRPVGPRNPDDDRLIRASGRLGLLRAQGAPPYPRPRMGC